MKIIIIKKFFLAEIQVKMSEGPFLKLRPINELLSEEAQQRMNTKKSPFLQLRNIYELLTDEAIELMLADKVPLFSLENLVKTKF
jgi:hypothetical protein